METTKRLNVKLLLLLVVGTFVVTIGSFFLWRFQVNRNAGKLLTQSQNAAASGETRAAADLLARYLHYRGEEALHWVELANLRLQLVDEGIEDAEVRQADLQMTVATLEQALLKNPDDQQLRRDAIDFFVRGGGHGFRLAAKHIEILQKQGVDEPKLNLQLAKCRQFEEKPSEVVSLLTKLIGYDPTERVFKSDGARGTDLVDAYVLLARTYELEQQQPSHADRVIDQLVVALPNSFDAHLARGRFLLDNRSATAEGREKAEEEINKAAELDGDDFQVLVLLANAAVARQDFDEAQKRLDRGLELYPDNPVIYEQLRRLALSKQEPNQAMEYVKRGLERFPGNGELLFNRAVLEIRASDVEAARSTIDTLKEQGAGESQLKYLRAQLLIVEKKWVPAAEVAASLRRDVVKNDQFHTLASSMLAQCYQQLGQYDLALEVYEGLLQESKSAATTISARQGAASCLSRLSREEEALKQYRALYGAFQRASPAALVSVLNPLLQLKINEQLRIDPAERDWSQVDAIFGRLRDSEQLDEIQIALLHAQLLSLRGDAEKEEARALVAKAREDHPDDRALWFWQVDRMQREQGNEQALQELEKIAEQSEDSVGLRLKRATIHAAIGGENAVAEVQRAERDVDDFTSGQLDSLRQGLAVIYQQMRRPEDALRLFRDLREANPNSLQLRISTFDVARQTGDQEAVAKALDDIAELVGRDSATWKYYEATRLVWAFQSDMAEQDALSRARQLLFEVHEDRPDWHLPARLEGEIAALDQDEEGAIEWLLKAAQRGPMSSSELTRLAQLLVSHQRPEEARDLLARQVFSRRSESDQRLEVMLLLRDRKFDQALALARKIVPPEAGDPSDQMWIGRTFAAVGRVEEAEEAFRRAVEVGPKQPTTWLSLVRLLIGAGKPADALAAIRVAQIQLPESQVPLTLGQCYQSMRNFEQAQHYYMTALATAPENLSTLRTVAMFYIQSNRPVDAHRYLDRMMAGAEPYAEHVHPYVAWARRTKATLLARTASYQDFLEGLQLIEGNVPKGADMTAQDLLTWTQLAASRPEGLSRQRAIQKLEQARRRGEALGDSQLLILARLYFQAKQLEKCRDVMRGVLARNSRNPRVIEPWCQMLLQEDRVDEAKQWAARLNPRSEASVRIQAFLAAREGKTQEVVDAINAILPDPIPADKPQVLGRVAQLYEQLGVYDEALFDEAEKLYRRYVDMEPGAVLYLAHFLGRRGRVDEAFELCDGAVREQPISAVIQIGIDTLRRHHDEATSEQFGRVQQWFDRGLREFPDSKTLLLQQAEFKDIEGETEIVLGLYRDYLARTDTTARQRSIVQNNLAFMLALRGESLDEAQQLIQKAIDELGPTADLLDTRGMVYLARKRPADAIKDLQASLRDGEEPLKLFHLAQAEYAFGRRDDAKASLMRAIELELTPDRVPELERDKFDKLLRDLNVSGFGN